MVFGTDIRHRGRLGVRAIVRLLVPPLMLAFGAVTQAEDVSSLRPDVIGLRSLERALPRNGIEMVLPPDTPSPQVRWAGDSPRFFDTHLLPSLYDELRNETDFARGLGRATGAATQHFLLEQTLVLRLRDRLESKWARQFGRKGDLPVAFLSTHTAPVSARPKPTSDFEVGLSGSGPELGWAYRDGPVSLHLSLDVRHALAVEYSSTSGGRAARVNAELDPVRGRYQFHLRFDF